MDLVTPNEDLFAYEPWGIHLTGSTALRLVCLATVCALILDCRRRRREAAKRAPLLPLTELATKEDINGAKKVLLQRLTALQDFIRHQLKSADAEVYEYAPTGSKLHWDPGCPARADEMAAIEIPKDVAEWLSTRQKSAFCSKCVQGES